MLKLKVCGMRNAQNIEELLDVHPDFIGLIFHENSPRNISEPLMVNLAENIKRVGVFVNKTENFIVEKIKNYNLSYVQLHGSESPEFCKNLKALGIKIIKAFNIHNDFDFDLLKEYVTYCDYFLFDAFGKNSGGNGITFNWKLLDKYSGSIPFLLSGGIDNTMAKEIKKINHKMLVGLDINSKFEIEPGLKNIDKIKAFKDEL